MATKEVEGGFKVKLVQLVDDAFKCSHCSLLLRDPVQTACGHRFCSICFKQLMSKSNDAAVFFCPLCLESTPSEFVYTDKFAAREIYSLRTACIYDNCPWQGEVREFEAHVKACPYATLPCPNKGCNKLLSSQKLKQHIVEECEYRQTMCNDCGVYYPFKELQENHKSVCPKRPVKCPNTCGQTNLLYENLEEHFEVCPKAERRCPFSFAGCTFKGVTEKLQQHLAAEMISHVEFAAKSCKKLETSLFSMRSECQQEKQRADLLASQLEQLSTFMKSSQNEVSTMKILFAELKESIEQLRNSFDVSAGRLLELESRTDSSPTSLNVELNGLRKKAEIAERRTEELERTITEQVASESVIGSFYDTPGSQSLPSGVASLSRLDKRIENVDHQLVLQDVQLAELNLKLQLLEVTCYNGSLVWKIDNIHRRKTDATRGKTPSLYSPPFFCGRFGYKACSRIYLNGDGMGKGKYISLFFTVMRGEYDALLKWPFQQKVTFKLLDLENRNNDMMETFRPDPLSASFKRPVTDMNLASGCPLFAEQEKVFAEESPYIRDDALYIEVSVDCSGLQLDF